MISEQMQDALNKQLQKEFYSAYLYLGMSAWCSENGLNGSAKWFMIQFEEEQMHAMKVYHYLLGQGNHIELLSVKPSKTQYDSLLSCFEQSLSHERAMTKSFNTLCDMALKEKDHATYTFLQWFVNEQVEEEATVGEVIGKLKLVGNGNGLFMIDSQLLDRQPQVDLP
ncbi:MAG: ferritin [Epsilonproteobacteria bacterium]|nr:ferritin [Campylobacterota bacterium]